LKNGKKGIQIAERKRKKEEETLTMLFAEGKEKKRTGRDKRETRKRAAFFCISVKKGLSIKEKTEVSRMGRKKIKQGKC